MSVELDVKLFHKRARLLLSTWKSDNDGTLFKQADVLVIPVGTTEEELVYQKSIALQTWLLKYEFPDTLIILTTEKIVFYTSAKKAAILEPLANITQIQRPVAIEIIKRSKNLDENIEKLEEIAKLIESSRNGKVLGAITKDVFKGKMYDEWISFVKSKNYEKVDIAEGLSHVMAVKDSEELIMVDRAAKLSSLVARNYLIEEISHIIDEERTITHDALTSNTENCLFDPKRLKKLKIPSDVNLEWAEWCYNPIIQSGGVYDLKPSSQSNKEKLHPGVIIFSLGVRYRSYCSNLSRTILINPKENVEKTYTFLLDLRKHVLKFLTDGAVIRDVYSEAIAFIREKRPDLEKKFPKNIGFGIGLEFRESQYVLSAKNHRVLRAGMVLNLSVGFENLVDSNISDPKLQNYALLVADVIKLTTETPIILTDCTSELAEISYLFEDEEQPTPKKSSKGTPQIVSTQKSAILKTKLRAEDLGNEVTADQKRKQHQKNLATELQAQGLARFGAGKENEADDREVYVKKFESYKKDSALPKEVKNMRIMVDVRNETIIVPIYGMAVPFHISVLKNASKSDEGDYVYLRLNFLTPGQTSGKKDSPLADPNASFIRALQYRSTDTYRFSEIYKSITELKKTVLKRDLERKEMADLVEQAELIEVKGRRPTRLADVYVRPTLNAKKRMPSDLEIHANGLRYKSPVNQDEKIDLLFSNIKHLFFQPCDGELIVLIHVHLKNPIMIGKRKTKDVQFYRESVEQFDETGAGRRRRGNYGDDDELAMEQEERRKRALLNKEFQAFAEKIAESSTEIKLEVDIPFRELGFHGVPYRTNVILQPTTECLVHLSEPPFFIITLQELQIVHLERVQFGLKNFDMVFVFGDFNRAPVHVNSIPMTQLENVKEWLDSMDVAFTEGPVNLNWNAIMKTIKDDPTEFFRAGGWQFLQDDTNSEADDDSEEEISEFEPESDNFSESEESFSEASEASDPGSGSYSDEDTGEDWDELERKAKRADERKDTLKRDGYSSDDRPRKKSKKVTGRR